MTVSVDSLAAWGLQRDDKVRWRPTGRQVWVEARVTGVEKDGSVGCVDADGRARAVVAHRLEVERRTGRSGARRWVALGGPCQLTLFADTLPVRSARAGAPPRRRVRR